MSCPRCSGLAVLAELRDESSALAALRCPICGAIFGERLLDYHYRLLVPPPPRAEINLPIGRWRRRPSSRPGS